MTVVNFERVSNNYGVRLFKDATLISAIEAAEFITPTTTVFKAPTIKGIRVAAVYELVTGSWVELAIRISGDNILLDSVPAGQLMIVPKTTATVVQAGTKLSQPQELFVKTFPGFVTENFTITTYDTETTLPGPFEFALTKTGVYSDALGPIDVPASIWMRSKATVIGVIKTIPIVVTADIYL
jgi:hypothetical protein